MSNVIRALEHLETKFTQLTMELPPEIGGKLDMQTQFKREFGAVKSAYIRVRVGVNSYEASSNIENMSLLVSHLSGAGKLLNEYIEVAQFFADATKDTGRSVEFKRVDEGVHLEAKFGDTSVRTLPTIETTDEWNKLEAMMKLHVKLTRAN